jgi:hypothetical protein
MPGQSSQRRHARRRQLLIESLERREMMNAAPVGLPDCYSVLQGQVLEVQAPVTAATTSADLPNLVEVNSFSVTKNFTKLQYSQEYGLIAGLGDDGSLTIYDDHTGAIVSTASFYNESHSIDLTADGRYLFAADRGSAPDPTYVHRFDMQLRVWVVKQLPDRVWGGGIQAVSSNRFLTLSSTNYVGLWSFDENPASSPTLLASRSTFNISNILFDEYASRIYFNSTVGTPASSSVSTLSVVGDTIVPIPNSTATVSTNVGNGAPFLLSPQGTKIVFGSLQFSAPILSHEITYSTGMSALSSTLIFSLSRYWNAISGVQLGTLPRDINSDVAIVSNNEQWLWGFDEQFKIMRQYRLPGALPGVLTNDTDADADTLQTQLVSSPAHGSVALNANGYFQYTPDPAYNGFDAFTYRAFDGVDYSDPITVQISVWPYINNSSLDPQNYTATEDQTLIVSAANGLLNGAIDAAGNALQVSVEQTTAHGTLILQANGAFTYAPNPDYFGPDSFTYRISGDGNTSQIGNITFFVNNVQDAPRPANDQYQILQGQSIIFDYAVSANTIPGFFTGLRQVQSVVLPTGISQIRAAAATNLVAAKASNKIYIIDASNSNIVSTLTVTGIIDDLQFTADGKYLFAIEDGSTRYVHRYDVQTKTWEQRTAVNDVGNIEPISATQFLVSGQLASLTTKYLSLNEFPENPSASIVELSRYDSTGIGVIRYDAAANSVYHEASTGSSGYLRVFEFTNNTLTFKSETYTGSTTSGRLSFDEKYVYFGSTQYDKNNLDHGTPIRTYATGISAVANHLALVNDSFYNTETGVLLYDFGLDIPFFTTDKSANSFWIYRSDVKQLVQYQMPGTFDHPASNDLEVDGDKLTFSIVTPPTNAPLVMNGALGSFSYTPPANFVGTDNFVYRVTDAFGNSATATATIVVRAVNPLPTAGNDTYSAVEETALTINAATGLLVNDSSPSGGTLSVIGNTAATSGTVAVNANGSFTYTPIANFIGLDSFTYTVSNGTTYTTATVYVYVQNTPDAPVANNDAYTTPEDGPLTASATSRNILSNDTDVDGTVGLTAVLVSGPTNGNLVLNASGTFNYTPAPNYNGQDTFTYQAFDGIYLSNVATVTITISVTNDLPVANADSYLLPYSSNSFTVPAASGVLANDSDVEGSPLTAILVASPTAGTLTLNSDGSFTYTRGTTFVMSDSFTYRARESTTANSAIQTVRIELDTARIVLGNYTLLPNTPKQQIPIYITGGAPLTAINLRLQIGDGLNGLPEPIISAISYADTIWSGPVTEVLGGPTPGSQQLVQSSIAFKEAGVSTISNGKVATLTIDTTGIYGGNFAFQLKGTQIGQDSDVVILGGGASPMFLTNGTLTIPPATVTKRQTFYNNSYFDGFNPAITPSDLSTAIATDKTALLPGQAATFANYTSYTKGINGVVIEVENIQYQPQLDEFEFRTGNTTTPSAWSLLTVPPTMTVETLAAGKVRIYFTWPDNTITKQWLEVLVKAKGPMGLPLDDVFYFGNAIGETGNQTANAFVDGSDFTYTRDNKHNFLNRALINDPADFNRDSLVDGTDLVIARDNSTNFINALKLYTPPAHVTPARTPYVLPSMSPGLTVEPTDITADNSVSQPAEQYMSMLAALPAETTTREPVFIMAPTPAPVSSDSPNLAAFFTHVASSNASTTSDDISDDLFLTLRKKKVFN